MSAYSVVDIFAGPGGLAEGFSAVRRDGRNHAFRIALSVEKEASAHSTLRLRAFLRQFGDQLPLPYHAWINGRSPEPDWEHDFAPQWRIAVDEAWQLELGNEDPTTRLDPRLDKIREEAGGRTVLIGGPPCQAYSLVGRARNRGNRDYVASEDGRHFLYREYIRILDRLRPAAFVMENVKGLLSSSIDGRDRIFDRVLEDLRGEGRDGERYRLLALAPKRSDANILEPRPDDFVVRAEEFGIPQARHRVIIVGLRNDIAAGLPTRRLSELLPRTEQTAKVEHVLGGMPVLRSGLSRVNDDADVWRRTVLSEMDLVTRALVQRGDEGRRLSAIARSHIDRLRAANDLPPRSATGTGISEQCPVELADWLLDPRLDRLPNHETRGHMAADLARYFFAAVSAEALGRSPKAVDFPDQLAPDHRSWSTGKFADRFRVQLWGAPSTTVTSHIAKDGHYFIHPDPLQCRSLTVREAARLQTFPDNYLFTGNRTQQYVQVGNAVPPLLARKIGEAVLGLLDASGTSTKIAHDTARLSSVA